MGTERTHREEHARMDFLEKEVMSKEFKVGDRVAVYHGEHRYVGEVNRLTGDVVRVVGVNFSPLLVHSKQCRRLKPRKNRRYFAKSGEIHDMTCTGYVNTTLYRVKPNNEYDVELIEVRRKK